MKINDTEIISMIMVDNLNYRCHRNYAARMLINECSIDEKYLLERYVHTQFATLSRYNLTFRDVKQRINA